MCMKVGKSLLVCSENCVFRKYRKLIMSDLMINIENIICVPIHRRSWADGHYSLSEYVHYENQDDQKQMQPGQVDYSLSMIRLL